MLKWPVVGNALLARWSQVLGNLRNGRLGSLRYDARSAAAAPQAPDS